jgi:uncharacterized RDD family membrane protein YckC
MSGEGPPRAANCAPSGGSETAKRSSVGATIARRFAALVYESLLLTAVVFAANFALLPLVTPTRGNEIVVPGLPERAALFCILFAVLAAYFVWCWSNGRRTLAMKTWKLRLVRAGGGVVTPKVALLRYLAAWIGPGLAVAAYTALARYGWGAHTAWLVAFNFLWAFVDRDRLFLHDRVAGTRLVPETK